MNIKIGMESPMRQIHLEGLLMLVYTTPPKNKFYLLDENLGPLHEGLHVPP